MPCILEGFRTADGKL